MIIVGFPSCVATDTRGHCFALRSADDRLARAADVVVAAVVEDCVEQQPAAVFARGSYK